MKLYSSRSSQIELNKDKGFLVATWLKDSAKLTEHGAKNEILKVLDFAKEHAIKKIVIDAREYPFRENYNLQHWINFTFMPQVMEANILKYAIIIDTPVTDRYEKFNESDNENLSVEYFKNLEDAVKWIG